MFAPVRSLLLILAVIVANGNQHVAAESEKELPAKSYKGTFGRVSNYLEEKVADNDTESNMAAVLERLKSGKADGFETTVLNKLTNVAAASDKCDQASYVILMDTDQITENGQHGLRFRKPPTKRIDQLLNFYCAQHAVKCQQLIMTNFKQLYPLLEEDVKHRVSTWMDAVSELHLSELKQSDGSINQLFNHIIRLKGRIQAVNKPKPAYDAIVTLSGSDFKRNEPLDRGQVIGLFKDLLLSSCNKYVELLGPDVFERANFDLNFHHDFDANETEFYKAWARYQLCTSFKLKFDWMWTFLSPRGKLADYAASEAERQI